MKIITFTDSKLPMDSRLIFSALMTMAVVLPGFLKVASFATVMANPIFFGSLATFTFLAIFVFKRFSEYNPEEEPEDQETELIESMLIDVLPFSLIYAFFPLVFFGFSVTNNLLTLGSYIINNETVDNRVQMIKVPVSFIIGAVVAWFLPPLLPVYPLIPCYIPAMRTVDHLMFGRVEEIVSQRARGSDNSTGRSPQNIFS